MLLKKRRAICKFKSLLITFFSINELKNLEFLNLSNNPLHNIGQNQFMLSNLTTLDLFSCEIMTIQSTFFMFLENLRQLNLNNNMLQKLPETISMLQNLEILSVKVSFDLLSCAEITISFFRIINCRKFLRRSADLLI